MWCGAKSKGVLKLQYLQPPNARWLPHIYDNLQQGWLLLHRVGQKSCEIKRLIQRDCRGINNMLHRMNSSTDLSLFYMIRPLRSTPAYLGLIPPYSPRNTDIWIHYWCCVGAAECGKGGFFCARGVATENPNVHTRTRTRAHTQASTRPRLKKTGF